MDIGEKASVVFNYAKDLSATLKRLASFVANKAPQQDMLQRGLLNPPSDKNERAAQGSDVLDILANDAKLVLQQAHTLTHGPALSSAPRPGMSPSGSSSSEEEND